MAKIFLDTEFTGLHQSTTLISLALYLSEDNYFYAEFNDHAKPDNEEFFNTYVFPNLEFREVSSTNIKNGNLIKIKGDSATILLALKSWLQQFDIVEIWSDVLAYDWVLICELFGGALLMPSNVYYSPFDLATVFLMKGMIIPKTKYGVDFSRYDFVGIDKKVQHNALTDAKVRKLCYDKIMNNG